MPGAAQPIPLESLPDWLERAQQLVTSASFEPALKACKVIVVSATTKNFQQSHGPNGEAWAPLKWRSGRPLYDKGLLMGSVTAGGEGSVSKITESMLVYGTNLDYAATHQYGATITPKAARALAVPVTQEARRSGGPRQMGDLHVVWPKGRPSGTLRDAAGKVQFALVKSVTIPARPFLGWNNDMADECGEIIADFGGEIVGKA